MLNVVFLPDYRVSLAELIIPTADLSEQISTAGKEASGTGNMKFALNGALTIGTLDGANIEILEEVGAENMYIFGLKSHEVDAMRSDGSYNPRRHYEKHLILRRVLDALQGDLFCLGESGLFQWIFSKLLDGGDPYFHLADFIPYTRTQQQAAQDFQNREDWAKRAILNVARMGRFSGDRTVAEYAREIWEINSA
jgi:starch phosphorylase